MQTKGHVDFESFGGTARRSDLNGYSIDTTLFQFNYISIKGNIH